jgi:hypothetical protein
MPSGLILENGTFPLGSVAKGSAKITFAGTFGEGTIALEEKINSEWVTMLDEEEAIVYTVPNSYSYEVHSGNNLRAVLTGATGARIPWQMTSN